MGIKTGTARAIVVIAGLALAGGQARATTLEDLNLVDLLRQSTSIVTGTVTAVTDGVDENGLPYTEITLAIDETMRGDETGSYTFRQFGLMQPRLTADGTRTLLPASEAFPRYAEGENVMLFLYRSASQTGLRTTTGLIQGKFTLVAGRAENGMANNGLFKQVGVSGAVITDNVQRMLDTEAGAVRADTFTDFVRRAVSERWLEHCTLWRTDVGATCRGVRRRPTTTAPRPSVGSPTTISPTTTTQFGR